MESVGVGLLASRSANVCFNIDKRQVAEWWSIVFDAIAALIGAEDRVGAQDLDLRNGTVAGFDWGARTANIMAAIWPERCSALASVSGYLIGSQQAGNANQ